MNKNKLNLLEEKNRSLTKDESRTKRELEKNSFNNVYHLFKKHNLDYNSIMSAFYMDSPKFRNRTRDQVKKEDQAALKNLQDRAVELFRKEFFAENSLKISFQVRMGSLALIIETDVPFYFERIFSGEIDFFKSLYRTVTVKGNGIVINQRITDFQNITEEN